MSLFDFDWYAPNVLKIRTKMHGVQPFKVRSYQRRYLHHIKNDYPDGIIRSIVLKPRQAGFSTLVAGINTHRMATEFHYMGILLADKSARTEEVHGIYQHYVNNIDAPIMPMVYKNNSEEIIFDNPDLSARKHRPGLGSGFKSETAKDPNAGRAGTRKWAHMSEHAFYEYADSIDEGVQNSIPLARGTFVCKESTAFGMTGKGAAFYTLWNAAEAGQSIYKPYFVAWFEIDDYALPVPKGFILTKEEIDLVKRCPTITNENLVWRRLKLREYSVGTESVFTPEERFKQDFPSYPEEAFLSTGRPVFDLEKLKEQIKELREFPPPVVEVKIKKPWLAMYPKMLTVFQAPQEGKRYTIGGDVAEGVETGDFSHAFVLEADTRRQVAFFHGHIDPDHFGNVLVDLAEVYNRALLVPEMNNMGHTTLEAIKKRGYLKVYMRAVYDEIDSSKETLKMGWRTTVASKQQMISRLVSYYRDSDVQILDINTLREMMACAREADGNVEITGKDRVAAACLALMGLDQLHQSAVVIDPNKKEKILFETKDRFREVMLGKRR
jgi:hypothetical protein